MTGGYKGLQGVTRGDRECPGVTRGDWELQRLKGVTEGYKG